MSKPRIRSFLWNPGVSRKDEPIMVFPGSSQIQKWRNGIISRCFLEISYSTLVKCIKRCDEPATTFYPKFFSKDPVLIKWLQTTFILALAALKRRQTVAIRKLAIPIRKRLRG
ncbi:hypothetical protein CEXT_738571 [Caerostris extrusa]|uniref:Uncharacterized protein n=1 Tax=Caerostris extrusa TaxID=172846 RepID=A0AAV4SR68_CAEEX|nr:hypothetical protein CEXT_738571 [Caerostris extrusa]